jgi:hypothetical protein
MQFKKSVANSDRINKFRLSHIGVERMKKVLLLLVVFFIFSGQVFSNSYPFKEGCDKYFEKQVKNLQYGTVSEKVEATIRLQQSKSRRAIRPLIEALQGKIANPIIDTDYSYVNEPVPAQHNSPIIKFYAAQALGKIGHELAAKALIDEYNLRKDKLDSKSQIGFFRDSRYLMREEKPNFATEGEFPYDYTFGEERNKYTMTIAVGEMLRAIGKLPYNATNEKALLEGLAHKNYYIRASAAEGLQNAGMVKNVEKLEQAAKNEKDQYTKASILSAIVNIQKIENENYNALLELLKSEDPVVRMRASLGLGDARIRSSETPLRQALEIEAEFPTKRRFKADIVRVRSFVYPAYMPDQVEPVSKK